MQPQKGRVLKETIDSHSSKLTNDRIHQEFIMIVATRRAAMASLNYYSIAEYYNALEALYIDTSMVLAEQFITKIEKARKRYFAINLLIQLSSKARTTKNVTLLLQLCKAINHAINYGLQERGYFYRMSTNEIKGLNNISFFDEHSIFATGKKNTDSEQTYNNDEQGGGNDDIKE